MGRGREVRARMICNRGSRRRIVRHLALRAVLIGVFCPPASGAIDHSQLLYSGCGGVWRAGYDGQAQRFVAEAWLGGLSPSGQEFLDEHRLVGIDGESRGTWFEPPVIASILGISFGVDGRTVYFGYQEDPSSGVYARDIVKVTKGAASPTSVIAWSGDQSHPAVSPDGTKIAFMSDTRPDGSYIGDYYRSDEDGWLYIANLDGSNPQLIVGPSRIRSGRLPSFSPDGTKILFSSQDEAYNYELSLVNVDGSGFRTIEDAPSSLYSGAWLANDRFAYSTESQVKAIDTDETDRSVLVDSTCDAYGTVATRTSSTAFDEQRFLASNYRPLLNFDSGERWRPLDVERLFLEEREGFPGQPNHQVENLSGWEPLSSPDQLRTWTSGAWIKINVDADQSVPTQYQSPNPACRTGVLRDCNDGPATTLYYHVTPETSGGYSYIDYWWLYRFNDFTSQGQHEADWEGVTVAPSKSTASTFDFVSYAQHETASRYPSSYLRGNLQCDEGGPASCGADGAPRGQRVWAFAAKGSHATYPEKCMSLCLQVNGLPEGRHDGLADWGRNNDDPADGSLTEFPVARGWDDPSVANWVDWPGKWGAVAYEPPYEAGIVDSPGNQARFKCPWRDWLGEPQACPSVARAHASQASSAEICESWFGSGVSAVACDPRVLGPAVRGGELGRRGQLRLLSGGREQRSASAPGIAQAMGRGLRPGSRIEVRGRGSARTQVAVRVRDAGKQYEAIFDRVKLGKRHRGVVTVARVGRRLRVALRTGGSGTRRPTRMTRTAAGP